MIVYIEQVIVDNLIVNFILLFLTNKILCKNFKYYKIILADLLGTFCAVVFPFFNIQGVLLLLIKICLGVVMVLIGCKIKNIRQFISCFFCFVFLTAVMGGLAFAIIMGIYPNASVIEGALIYNGLPMGVILLGVFLLLSLFYKLLKSIKKKNEFAINMCKLILDKCDISIKISAYIDSGNLLTYNEKPVIIISYPTFKKLCKIENKDFIKSNYNIENSCYITTQSANGQNKMLVFDIDKVTLLEKDRQRQLDCIIGLTLADIENKFGCNALIGSIALK